METEYSYRILRFEEAAKLVPLYRSAFNLQTDVNYVLSKFFHPYQTVQVSTACFHEDRIVSFYGVIVQRMNSKHGAFYIAQSCDSMTDPAYSGKGLFIKLAELAYKSLVLKGIDVVYGFPNKRIYGLRVNKLSWKHVSDINHYRFQVRTVPLAKAAKKFPLFTKLYFLYTRIALRKVISDRHFFVNSLASEACATIAHDREYFEYKQSPSKFIIRLNGLHFWIKIDGRIWVGDFDKTDRVSFEGALIQLKRIAAIIGCDVIDFHYQQNASNDLLLKNHTTPFQTMPVGFRSLTGKEIGPICFNAADFDTW